MNADMTEARWNEVRGGAQQRWGRLTSSDLDQIQGQATKLVGMVQDRYGYSRMKAEREVNKFLSQYGLDTGNLQDAAGSLLSNMQEAMSRYPWAFVAGAAVLALVLVGFVWKPFNR